MLVHIQAKLDENLSLTRLAYAAGLSAFHFAREFSEAAGETPKQFPARCERYRQSTAAFPKSMDGKSRKS